MRQTAMWSLVHCTTVRAFWPVRSPRLPMRQNERNSKDQERLIYLAVLFIQLWLKTQTRFYAARTDFSFVLVFVCTCMSCWNLWVSFEEFDSTARYSQLCIQVQVIRARVCVCARTRVFQNVQTILWFLGILFIFTYLFPMNFTLQWTATEVSFKGQSKSCCHLLIRNPISDNEVKIDILWLSVHPQFLFTLYLHIYIHKSYLQNNHCKKLEMKV